MRRRLVILGAPCAVVLFLGLTGLAGPKPAAKVAGNWQLVLAGMTSRTMTLVLTQDGAKIKGTLGKDAKGGLPITGTVDGNKIKFGATVGKPNGPTMSQKFTGTVNGDAMTGTVEVVNKGFTGFRSFMNMDRSLPWTARRQK